MSISRSYISEGMDVVDVSTEWILNISVILNATARDSTVPMYSNTVRTNKYARMVGRERIPFYFSTASFDFKQEGMYRGPRQSKVLRRPEFVVVVGGTTPRGTTVRASSC